MAKTVMLMGTSSHVGKSIITTALCRIFQQQGQKVILIAGLVTDDAQVVVVIYHIADGTQIIGLIDCDFHPFVHRKFRDKGGESIDNIAPSWYGKLIPRFITV